MVGSGGMGHDRGLGDFRETTSLEATMGTTWGNRPAIPPCSTTLEWTSTSRPGMRALTKG